MSVTIHDVLGGLRESALDTRDQGDKFEALVLSFLRTDPEWVGRFSDVWLWQDWPGRDGRRDTGVDLVARFRDSDGLAAIQCTFYDGAHRVSKGDLDTFLSASGGSEFVARYFFDTADALVATDPNDPRTPLRTNRSSAQVDASGGVCSATTGPRRQRFWPRPSPSGGGLRAPGA